jgi:hypothetical protein
MSALLNATPKAASTGRLPVTDDTSTPDHFSSGIPYESDGTVAIDLASAVAHYYMAMPFTAAGRIAASVSSVTSHGNGAIPYVTGKLSLEDAAVASGTHGVGYTAGAELSAVGLP